MVVRKDACTVWNNSRVDDNTEQQDVRTAKTTGIVGDARFQSLENV